MRFLSKYGRFGVQIQPLMQEAYASGMARVTQEPVYAFFKSGREVPLRPEERELAVSTWTFNGSYQEQDEFTIVPPDYRIGVFDSEETQIESNWSDETRVQVENELSRLAGLYGDIIVVPRTTIPPPWPRYDDYTGKPATLVRKLVDEGHNIEAVLTYEKAMQNRPEVVTALEELLASDEMLLPFEEEEEVLG